MERVPSNVLLARHQMHYLCSSPSYLIELDQMRELFGQWNGSLVSTRRTYVPVGKFVGPKAYNAETDRYLSVCGSRVFNAEEWDRMRSFMSQYENMQYR